MEDARAEICRCLIEQRSKLFAAALKLTKNPVDAEDLLHDAAILAIQKHQLYKPGSNPYGWIARIIFNTFVSQYRRRKKGRVVSAGDDQEAFDVAAEAQHDPEDEPAKAISREDIDPVLIETLMSINDKYATALWFTSVEGMSYKHAAHVLSIPVGTLMSRLCRAKEIMRKKLPDKFRQAA